jgi:hypothetical protein
MAFGFGDAPLRKIGFAGSQPQAQAQAGLPLVIQQLYGGVPFTPGADTMEGGFRTSPGFRPGAPMNINMPAVAPTRPGFIDFMPKIPGVPFGAQTTLADLSAFNPVANQYALAGFTVGEILAMPEFADFAQFQAQQTGGTATSAGLAALEAQLQQLGAKGGPEDRPGGFGPKTNFQPTSMKFVDGKLVYDKINPAINQQILGIAEDQPVPGIPSLFSALKTFGTSLVDDITSPFTKYREKKAQEEREARIAEEKKAQLEKINEMKKQFEEREQKKKEKQRKEQLEKINEIKKQFEEREQKRKEKEAKDKADRDKAQRTGTGFTTDKERDTATGKFSGPKGDGPGKGPGKGCFVKGTMIEMADGTEKEITTIKVGEETKGGQVQAKMEFLPERIYDYKGVKVSGSHWVIEDNQFVAVENSKHGVLTDRLETVYCFKTSDNRIWIKGIEFGDFETGSDEDWEPHFEMVRQKLNKQLNGNI